MNNEKTQRIEKLLEEHRFEEARTLLNELFSEEMSEDDNGRLYSEYALWYMTVMNTVNSAYRDALEEAVQDLKELEKNERIFDDQVGIAKAKLTLKSL